jgi:hypothetical protein
VKIPADFVILEMPKDDNLSIILRIPFFWRGGNSGRESHCDLLKMVIYKYKGSKNKKYRIKRLSKIF